MLGLRALAEELSALDPDAATAQAVALRMFDSLAAVEVGRHVDDVAPLANLDDPASWIRFATAAGRATEADDIHVASCTTVGAVVVPAAILVADDSAGLVAAVAAGYEAMVRLGLAVDGASLVYRGGWTTLVCAPVAVAVAVARALGLGREATVSAAALAASRAVLAAPEPGAGVPPRWWAIGTAAADGWAAAIAAKGGVTADPESVRLPVPADELRLRTPLDRPAVLAVDTKAFPSARQTLPAVEAALEAAAGSAAEAIDRVALGLPAQVLAMVDRPGAPRNRLDSLVDVRYQVALALTRPDALYDAVRRPPFDPPALAARVDVAADDTLTARFPALGGRARVQTSGGERTATVERVRPFGWEELETKWRRIAEASGLSATRLGRLRQAAAALDPAALVELLR